MLASKRVEKNSRRRTHRQRKKATELVAFFVLFAYRTGRPEAVSGIAEASRGDLHLHYILSLWSLWTLSYFEFNFLALFEGLEAVALNGAVMNEDV
jgi:hypothetical protein